MNWQDLLRRPLLPPSGADACAQVRPLLSLMSDGMASPQEVRLAEAHLLTCADCRQAQLWMAATHNAIIARPPVLPPADMRARIALAIAASAETALPAVPVAMPPARRTFRLRPAYAAAASLAVAGAFLGHYLLTTPGQSVPITPVASTDNGTRQAAQPPAKPSPANGTPARTPQFQPPVVAKLPPAVRPTVTRSALSPNNMTAFVTPRTAPTSPMQGVPQTPTKPAVQFAPARVAFRTPPLLALPTPHRLSPNTGASKIATLPRLPAQPSAPQVSTPALAVPTPAPASETVASRAPETSSVPARVVPGDALSGVRVSLASARTDNYARRLSMANGVHLPPKYVLVPGVYTPTTLNETSAPRRTAVASRPVQDGAPQARLVSDTTAALPAVPDPRRSERGKSWTEASVPSGA